MGLDKALENMKKNKPKRYQLLNNLISVFIIFTILYAFFSILKLGDPLAFFWTNDFMIVALVLVMLYFAWKILHGAEIKVPQNSQFSKQRKPTKTNPPKIKKPQVKTYQQPRKPVYTGSWWCPRCETYVIQNPCPFCGERK